MTYKEKFDQLRLFFVEKSDAYKKVDKELSSVNGFFDGSLLKEFEIAKKEFEIAGNNYHDFLIMAKQNNAMPSDIYSK